MTLGARYRIFLFAIGAIMALALPPSGYWPIMFGAVPVFLWRLHNAQGVRDSFWLGFSLGFGYFCVCLHWIGFAFLVDASTYLWMMPFAVGGLAAFLSIYWGLAAAASAMLLKHLQIPVWLGFPVALSLAELLRGRLFSGFAWGAPGLVTDSSGSLLQLASLVGMTGLTLLVMLWSASTFPLLAHLPKFGREKILPSLVLITLPLAWFWGEVRLRQNPTLYRQDVGIRLVQPNLPQDNKWREENAIASFNDLAGMTAEPEGSTKVTVVVWPESAVSFLLDESPNALAKLANALGNGRLLLAGSLRRSEKSATAKYFTSVMAIEGAGVRAIYDKWRLVPGGEFLPLEFVLRPLGFRRVVELPESFTSGTGPVTLDIGDVGKVAPLICYEVIFPHGLVDIENRPDWLVNITNDGWFGHSTGPYQHLAQARMRSVEQGLPLMRAANTGISASIDPMGRILAKTALGEKTMLDVKLPQAIGAPLYARVGDMILLVMIALIIVTQLVRMRRNSI